MAFQLSPGVNVSEIDLTTIVPAVGTTEGAFAGHFVWGPVNAIVTISNEEELLSTFGRPNGDTFISFFTAANFLSYARNLKVVRAANSDFKNATSGSVALNIGNRDVYEEEYFDLSAANTAGMFAARYPGNLGNSLKVSLWASSNPSSYSNWDYSEEFNGVPGTSVFVGSNNGANDEMHIIVLDEDGKFTGAANSVLEKYSYVSKASDAKNDDGSSNYYVNVINDRSRYVYIMNHAISNTVGLSITINDAGTNYSNGFIIFSGGTGTDANISVSVDQSGTFQGFTINHPGYGYSISDTVTANVQHLIANTVPAAIAAMTNAVISVTTVSSNTDIQNWGTPSQNTTYRQTIPFYTASLANGSISVPEEDDVILAYDKFKNAEEVDISLVLTGGHSRTVVQHVIDNLVTTRKDCVAFVSPERGDVVNNSGDEADDVVAYRNEIARSTSYAVMDSGWKYQFDKYNNVYRWVPLNGDIAGLCVRTDFERDPWFSPAGFNRGQLKNVVKLAWNPDKTDRDELYKNGVNPVVSFPGEGVVLYGDKTMLAKPSAFDRINVRRLFIVLEKAIARAAKYSLFEFNDEFTRAQFVALVEPFLRDVQGRRGIFDFRVVCDSTNNTPEVIDRNEFIGDIYIKPARSINFIQLNFVAVRSGVAFEEVVGRF
jgi:hypothetical protein